MRYWSKICRLLNVTPASLASTRRTNRIVPTRLSVISLCDRPKKPSPSVWPSDLRGHIWVTIRNDRLHLTEWGSAGKSTVWPWRRHVSVYDWLVVGLYGEEQRRDPPGFAAPSNVGILCSSKTIFFFVLDRGARVTTVWCTCLILQ